MIHPSVDPSTKPRVVVSWNGRDGEWKKKRCVRDDANEEDGRWLPRYLTSSVFVLCHLFLNSSPLISTRRRPTFPRSSCSVRPCLVITSLLPSDDASSSFFFRQGYCLSLSLYALVCSVRRACREQQPRTWPASTIPPTLCIGPHDPMLRNGVLKF